LVIFVVNAFCTTSYKLMGLMFFSSDLPAIFGANLMTLFLNHFGVVQWIKMLDI
jgi:hypothetical protein